MHTFLIIVTVLNTYYYHDDRNASVTPMPDWHTCAQVRDAVSASFHGASNGASRAVCITTR